MEWSSCWETNNHSASEEITAFRGTRRFITVFTRAPHWSLSWARWIQSATSHLISLRSILLLFSHLRLLFRITSSLQVFRPIFCIYLLSLLVIAYFLLNFYTRFFVSISMQHSSSWGPNRKSVKKFWGPRFITFYKSPPLTAVLSQLILVYTLMPVSLRSSLILSFRPRLDVRDGLFLSVFPAKDLCTIFICPVRATAWPSLTSWLHHHIPTKFPLSERNFHRNV